MQGEIENQPDMDDWGDFSAVISGLEQTEVSELTDLPTEAANDDSKPAGEMFQGALSVLFTIAEQATTIISGVDFEFDEKGKAAVIDAALPVLESMVTRSRLCSVITWKKRCLAWRCCRWSTVPRKPWHTKKNY